ncbi:MAG TPA: ABC transporter permease [Candidatus Limnocylindria bacterium]|nr:ABC transporter permease [Candidatus Limnocylindria bacterium]
MSARRTAAVAKRIVEQFRHDRRTLGLIVVAPLLVLTLVWALWGSPSDTVLDVAVGNEAFARIAAPRLEGAGHRVGGVATYEEVVARVRDGRAHAGVWGGSLPIRIVVEGSDPIRTSGAISALERALLQDTSRPSAVGGVVVEHVYGRPDLSLLDFLAPVLIAFFGFFFMFLLATVSFLRERQSGTLERLLASPLRRGELVLGYLLGFGVFALIQSAVILGYTIFVIQVRYRGSLATIFLVEAVLVLGAVALGLAISSFARNELQAVQFIPIVILPQAFLSGLLVPVEDMHEVLRAIASVLPLTYANEALRAVMIKGYALTDPLVLRDVGVMALFAAAAIAAAVLSIRREVA